MTTNILSSLITHKKQSATAQTMLLTSEWVETVLALLILNPLRIMVHLLLINRCSFSTRDFVGN